MTTKANRKPLSHKLDNSEYVDIILGHLLNETNNAIVTPIGLIIYLVEKYHPDFQTRNRGRSIRWNPMIEAILAVHIDNLRKNGCKSRRKAAELLVQDKIWGRMRPEYNSNPTAGIEQFFKIDKNARRSKNKSLYEEVKKIHEKYLKTDNLKGWDEFTSRTINLQLKNGDINLDLNTIANNN